MPKGGARARSGRAPDPNALRRDRDGAGWTTLPIEGRTGEPPEWPLADQTARELQLWGREWRRPQAIMWERNGQVEEVAMYVRAFAVAERHDATVAARTLIRQLQESLGISVPGLARNRWKIGDAAEAAKAIRAPKRAGSRSRFKVVAGGAGA